MFEWSSLQMSLVFFLHKRIGQGKGTLLLLLANRHGRKFRFRPSVFLSKAKVRFWPSLTIEQAAEQTPQIVCTI